METKTIGLAVVLLIVGLVAGYAGSSGKTITETQTTTIPVTETKTKILTFTKTSPPETMTQTVTQTTTIPVTETKTVTKTVTMTETITWPPLEKGAWNIVAVFNGTAGKTTDTFYIHSDKWRINWSYTGDVFPVFYFSVYSVENPDWPVYTSSMMSDQSLSDSTYIYEDPGEYFIDVNAANINQWSIIIEEWISE